MAKRQGNGANGERRLAKVLETADQKVRGSQAWTSIFRPGSVFRRGYTDSPRNRSYVIMNNVLYHLHPVKVKRHAVKVSYTLCLGGLSFFLFILLTVTGIFLMFFYRPGGAGRGRRSDARAVTFGSAVRNMHRWAAHLMVLTVFLRMAVFYHGAYKAPRANWVIGVILLRSPCCSPSPVISSLGPAGAVGGDGQRQHDGLHPGVQDRQITSCWGRVSSETLLRWYVLHVLCCPS